MNVALQTTLSHFVSCTGVGLHTGKPVHMVIYPAPADTGVVFKRLDVAGDKGFVAARYDAVSETKLGTTITNRHGVTVSTIEHLMAAFWGAGLDNAVVELTGPEVPIMDGSSEPFLFMLDCARVVKLAAPRQVLRILKNVEVREGDSVASVAPMDLGEEGMTLSVEIQFNSNVVGRQAAFYDFREMNFKQSISRARTFGFEHEVKALRSMGLALGGSLENAIVVGADGVLNEEGLRYNDEFVRHKALDCVGDLFLAGMRIEGHLSFVKPGHAINNKLLRAVFADESAYVIAQPGKVQMAPAAYVVTNVPAYA
ncbi:MAG: UDP-3-O-acyl-N-acetylglucosamine deacetylase [Rickettsiales bacterium]|nr:UDP-3-O-acyl-N-acetylglucosamine deacetylase [Rickettsiales bacterium]